jgi:hypothetical protein
MLSKKPCGQPAPTRCANCEMALCSKHAIPQLAAGKKTGKFMCKECDAAKKEIDKAEAKKQQQAGSAPAAAAPRPAAAPAAKPAAPGAAPKEAPKPPEKKEEDSGGIDFTPSKK